MTASTTDQQRPARPATGRRSRWPAKAELALAVAVTGLLVLLHLRFFVGAGSLWRDEISSVEIARSPTLGEMMDRRVNDSVPLLWHLMLRGWSAVGLGGTDQHLRVLGLGVGLGIVAALWGNGRTFGGRAPLAGLVMVGLCPMTVCFGDSLRAYGLGVLMGLLGLGAIFRATQAAEGRPAVTSLLVAMALSLLGVHANFYNCVWLFAACTAGAALCLMNGHRARAAAILGIGAACAASLAVYVPLFRSRAKFNVLFVYDTPVSRLWDALCDAVGFTPARTATHAGPGWICVTLLAVLAAAAAIRRRPATGAATGDLERRRLQRTAAQFGLLTLAIGVPAYVGFLLALSNQMQTYYYLSFLALIGGCLDPMLAAVTRRGLQAVAVVVAGAVALPPAWDSAGTRLSNVSVAATRLADRVQPGDVIVLMPWWLGSAFVRYYHGPGRIIGMPPLADLTTQRFDLFVEVMRDPHAADGALAELAAAARAGHTAWIVRAPQYGVYHDPREPLPTPNPTWHDGEYYVLWGEQIGDVVRTQFDASTITPLDLGPTNDVNPLERVIVFSVRPRAPDYAVPR